jgi:CRP-like cAMP-binding protein
MERELFEVLSTAMGEPLPLELQSVVAARMSRTTIKKGEIILRPDQINKKLYFIQRGQLRAYKLVDGVEKTSWIRGASEFAVSISSFYFQLPSVEFMHATEDTEVFLISFDDFWHIVRKHHEFALIALVLIIPVLVEWDQKIFVYRDMSTKEKLEWVLQRHSELLNGSPNLPEKSIATFLGISPQWFSKAKTDYFGLTGS